MPSYLENLEHYESLMLQNRRYLHQHPEVSFHEYETVKYIKDFLSSLAPAQIIEPTATSVIAVFKGSQAGAKIGLRADTDALPIQEDRPDLDFQSLNPGVMHACGHDMHTAMLMATCQWLNDHPNDFAGEIYCIFQHAEELPPGGAQEIMDTGVLDELEFVYGQHVSSDIELGYIDVKPGAVTSNTDEYHLVIKGKGGHSSTPEVAINPINVALQILQAFESIPSQSVSPLDSAVIANTYVEAGHPVSLNIIPNDVKLGGSVRTFKDEVADQVSKRMSQIVKGISEAHGVTADFTFVKGCKSVINDTTKTQFIESLAEDLFPGKVVHLPASMGGEDFEVYSRKIPSCFVWLGARNDAKGMNYPHHHPKFAVDEACMLMGFKMFLSVINNYK